MKALVGLLGMMLLALSVTGMAASGEKEKPQYTHTKIQAARFGDPEKQLQMEQALMVGSQIDSVIFGQEAISETIKDKLALYLDGLNTERREPVAINLVGLPGLGKTAIIEVLNQLGFQILKFDAQNYAHAGSSGGSESSFAQDLENSLYGMDTTKPIFLVVEEIDKLPEIDQKNGAEITQNVIGTLNQILSEGKFNSARSWGPRQSMDASKFFVITTMNLSPNEISDFSADALGVRKSFYDFTIEDFGHFHKWLSGNTAAIPKVLSRLFRPNTVSRLMPISALVNPLNKDGYRKIVAKTVASAIRKTTQGDLAGNRLEIQVTEAMIDYLNTLSIYAPSGARSSVFKTDQLMRQLILFSKRLPINPKNPEDQSSLNLPRKVEIDFNTATGKVVLNLKSLKIMKNRDLVEDQATQIEVSYSTQTGLFTQPASLVQTIVPLPESKAAKAAADKPILKKEIRSSRFPAQGNAARGLSHFINQELFGQSRYSKLVETAMNQYLVRPKDAKTAPVSVIFAGFPGIGKSEMINLTGRYLELPIIKINLQQYTSNSPETAGNLISFIADEIRKIKAQDKQRYILLIEELDKVYEIDPSNGAPVDRPVMGIIKDLMNNGQAEVRATKSYGQIERVNVDVRDAFVAVTMNFAMDRFQFKADPRLTTLDDVTNAWKRLSTRLADLKQILGSIFLPETVNRMISNIFILKPLAKADYVKVIEKQKEIILKDRFPQQNGKSVGQIDIRLSAAYKEYLFNESVVPSEGARFAAKVSRSLIALDFESALKTISKKSVLAARPLLVTLDYDPETRTVAATINTTDSLPKEEFKNAYTRVAELNFPPLNMTGKVPKERLVTSLHEFGHALAAMRAGLPFESITVVPPQNSVGGYVKFRNQGQSADELIGSIYSSMASRAMERVMLSHHPEASSAVVDITAGASSDILQATKLLFNVIHELGFDPHGGVIERMGVEGPVRYANFSDLPHEAVEALALILRDIEDTLVHDFMKLHPREWYADKIYLLALAGGMSEKEFYELNEVDYPGEMWKRVDRTSPIFELFKGRVLETDALSGFDWNPCFEHFKSVFMDSVEQHLHHGSSVGACQRALNR